MGKQRVAKQYLSLDATHKRLQDKIEKIHTKFGNILENSSQDYSYDFTVMKNRKLKDLAKDLKLSMDPCKGF